MSLYTTFPERDMARAVKIRDNTIQLLPDKFLRGAAYQVLSLKAKTYHNSAAFSFCERCQDIRRPFEPKRQSFCARNLVPTRRGRHEIADSRCHDETVVPWKKFRANFFHLKGRDDGIKLRALGRPEIRRTADETYLVAF